MIKKNEESYTQDLSIGVTIREDTPIIEILSKYTRLSPRKIL